MMHRCGIDGSFLVMNSIDMVKNVGGSSPCNPMMNLFQLKWFHEMEIVLTWWLNHILAMTLLWNRLKMKRRVGMVLECSSASLSQPSDVFPANCKHQENHAS